MKSHLIGTVAIVAGLLTSGSPMQASPKLMLRVTPAVGSAPANVVVTATVEKNASNRALEVAADSGSFYRSSEVQLEGDQAPLVTQVRLKNLPGGKYDIVAVLRDADGHRTVARSSVMILSAAGER